MGWQIAIDGPAASGKSTVAKGLAKKLGFEYLDTGAMYRAVTLKALQLKINLENEEEYHFLENTKIDFIENNINLDDVDVSKEIRSIEVTNNVSLVSKFKYVRDKMVAAQRKLSESKDIILDGRDIGTVVLPNANLKIFLYANVETRAKRRMKEREESGVYLDLNETIKEIEARDYKDSHREISPLTQADDAVFLDTSEFTVEEVINEITRLALKRGYSMEDLEQKNVNVEEEQKQEVEQKEATETVEEVAEAEIALPDETEQDEKTGYKEMQIVTGTVVEVQEAQDEKKFGNKVIKAREERVLIELPDGQEGFLFRKDCANIEDDEALFDQFIEGDEITVAIKKIFPDGGKFIFSQILVERYNKLKEFEATIKERPIIKAKVIKLVSDFGLLMKYEDFTCLLPVQLVATNKENVSELVGKELEVVPIRIDEARIRIVVSEIGAVRKKQKAERKEFISQLAVGQVYEGTVKNIEPYGAFIELHEGVEGLLHISEFDHNRVQKIEKVLNPGDAVKVQVIKIEKDHIGLSRKALLPNHWANYFADKKVNDVVSGEVLEIKSSGIRIKLAEELEGFIPKSEFSWNRDVVLEEAVKVGDEISCKIIETEKYKRRIILSVKQLSVNPWSVINVEVGSIINVKVVEVLENGYKVDYQDVNGYMAKGAVKPSEMDKVIPDAEIKVKVRVFDADKQRLIVSMRDAEEKIEKENYNKYKSTDKMSNTFGDYLNEIKKNK